MWPAHWGVLALASVLFVGEATARGPCLKYGGPGREFTGPVTAINASRTGKSIRYWVLRLPAPACVDGGTAKEDVPEKNVKELQLAFPDGSPYYSIYRNVVNGRAVFRVTGRLYHARSPSPVRRVAVQVEDFVPRNTR